MKTRFLYSLLALLALFLPGQLRAQTDQGYVELKVNNGAASIGAADATLSLTFLYGEKPANAEGEIDDATVWYFDLNTSTTFTNYLGMTEAERDASLESLAQDMPGWLGYTKYWTVSEGTYYSQYAQDNTPSAYFSYSPRITDATFDESFAQARPQTCAGWFMGCIQIESVKGLQYLNTQEATSLAYMFHNCRALSDVDVSAFRTASVTTFRTMFGQCISLQSLNVRTWDMSKANNIGGIFSACRSLQSLDLSTWTLTNLSSTSNMFSGMKSLTTLDISNFDMSQVTNISSMFSNCTNLETIYVGEGWTTSSVFTSVNRQPNGTYISYISSIFNGATRLVGSNGTTYADLQQAIREEAQTEGSRANQYGTSFALAWLTYARPDGGPEAPGLLTSTKAFAVVHDGGDGHKTLYLCNRGSSEVKANLFKPASFGEDDAPLTTGLVVINNLSTMGESKWKLHDLLDEAGVDVAEIDEVVIEPSFAYLRPATCEEWFSGMANATFTGLRHLNTSACTNMRDMFKDCAKLEGFSIKDGWEEFNTTNVTDMSGLFSGCTALATVDFTPSDHGQLSTGKVTTMRDMFSGCAKLTDISSLLEYANTSSVTDMGGMFRGCASLKGNTVDKKKVSLLDLSNFNTAHVTDMSDMFNGCEGLIQLNLTSFNTAKVTQMKGMFQGCPNLFTIFVNLTWETDGVTDGGEDMFDGCDNLEGSAGTAYESANENDVTFAHIDGGEANPGYLTESGFSCTFYGDAEHAGINASNLQTYNGFSASVTIVRDFKAGEWTTLTLPIDLTAKQVTSTFGTDVQLKTLSGTTRSGDTATGLTFEAATAIEAGKPYLIRPSKDVSSFTFSHKTVKAATSTVTKSGLSMCGALNAETLSQDNGTIRYILKDEQTSEPTSIPAAYSAVTEPTLLPALHAYFVDMKVSDYELTIPEDGVSTLYLPYAVEIPEADYFVAATVKEFTYGSSGITAVMQRIKQGIIPAYTGVFVQANPGTYTMAATEEKTSEELTNWLHGTLEETRLVDLEYDKSRLNGYASIDERIEDCDDEDYVVFFVKKGLTENFGFKYTTASYTENRVWKNDLTMTVPANKAYLMIDYDNETPLVKSINIVFEDGEATGIEDVETAAPTKADGIYYSLSGQRVATPTRGIYIKDGKKVYVK